ncbi:MAG: DUF3293 domain-containing protein [Elusimicrobia bacterium]|nr:DUF3293 domain-containing protein [Elusimicrobiota bacterium]
MASRLKAPYFAAYFKTSLRGKAPARFAVVTAHNPMGHLFSPVANRKLDAALRRRLDALKIRRFRVTGGSEDGSHREAGWGLIIDSPAKARALAAEFDQNAFYWVRGGRIYLGSSAGGPLKRAGSWSERRARWR